MPPPTVPDKGADHQITCGRPHGGERESPAGTALTRGVGSLFVAGSAGIVRDMSTSASPRVLVIGLDPTRVPGPWDPAPVVEGIKAGMAKFAEHGVAAESCLFGLDGSDDIEAVVTAALRAHPWECVTVGGGLRHSDDLVELLELVINLIRRYAPNAAIAFNDDPSTTYEAAARWIA